MNEQGIQIELPEKLQEAINLAEAKVSVLRDEVARLEDAKSSAYREVARLTIEKDALSASVAKLAEEESEASASLESVSGSLATARQELEVTLSDRKVALKELDAAKEATKSESARLSEIVAQQRLVGEEIAADREALAKKVEIFETRKARVVELLSSI